MEFADIPLRKVQVQFGEMHLVGLQGKSAFHWIQKAVCNEIQNWAKLVQSKNPEKKFKSFEKTSVKFQINGSWYIIWGI